MQVKELSRIYYSFEDAKRIGNVGKVVKTWLSHTSHVSWRAKSHILKNWRKGSLDLGLVRKVIDDS